MRNRKVHALLIAGLLMAAASGVRAQELSGNKEPDVPATPPPTQNASLSEQENIAKVIQPAVADHFQGSHRFWDAKNDWLFAGVGAGRTLDYASTLNLRRRGINEIFLTNSIVDNHPLFAGIEAAATAASIGASYFFHRTGHHRLERWTSIIHFSAATVGAARNYALKTPHPN